MSILRPYQRQALDAFSAALSPDVNRVAIELATGLGKTVTFAVAADEWLQRDREAWTEAAHCGEQVHPGRVLILVHLDKLARQAEEKIRAIAGDRWDVGVVMGERNDVHADIVVASVWTLANPARRRQIRDVGFVIVDECHHANTPTYLAVLRHFGSLPTPTEFECFPEHANWAGKVPTLGVTATLGEGGTVWQDLAFTRSLSWGIRKGYLIDIEPYTIKVPDITASASDADLDAMYADSIAPEAIVQAWVQHWGGGSPAPSTVLFAPLVASARRFADAFNDSGIKAEVIHGGTPDGERDMIYARYESGVTTVLCNAMVLNEGWDSPRTMVVVNARPTKIPRLLIQIVGRGTRTWLSPEAPPREEQRCLLLSVADATTDLNVVATLTGKPVEGQDGASLTVQEDEWDLGKDIEPDRLTEYRGKLVTERWDPFVQASSKAWKHTDAGVPFLPTAKHQAGYVFVLAAGETYRVMAFGTHPVRRKRGAWTVTRAPDLELALGLAEDVAQDLGGDIGALLADKSRPWRKQVPSADQLAQARRLGIDQREVERILAGRAAGKAGKLSDLMDKVTASRVLDPLAEKIGGRK